MTQIESFSDDYYILDADVIEYSGTSVGAPADLLEAVGQFAPAPVFKLGNEHVWAEPEPRVPADTIVVPSTDDIRTDVPVLLAKERETVGGLL